jgi:hypothetical protein
MLPLFPPSTVQNENSPLPVQVYWTTFILRTAEGGRATKMKAIGKRALALLASSLFGTTLWLAIFIAKIAGFEHLPGQQDVGVIDRVLVEAANYPGPAPIQY